MTTENQGIKCKSRDHKQTKKKTKNGDKNLFQ